MTSQLFDFGSKVVVKGKDGKDVKGTIFDYFKHRTLGHVEGYIVKLDDGGSMVAAPEQVTGSTDK